MTDKFTTTITGVNTRGEDADFKIRTLGAPDRVYLALVGDMNTNGIGDPDSPNRVLPVATCAVCDDPLDSDDNSLADGSETCALATEQRSTTMIVRHDPVPIPLAWANHAVIIAEPDRDRIMVGISVNDPRGGFFLEIYRQLSTDPCPAHCEGEWTGEPTNEYVHMKDGKRCETCNGTGGVNPRYELRMSLPHHTDGALHAPLTDLNGRGYYKIGY